MVLKRGPLLREDMTNKPGEECIIVYKNAIAFFELSGYDVTYTKRRAVLEWIARIPSGPIGFR